MKDKFNPYGIEKDYECKECFHQCYDKEVGDYVMGGCNLSENVKYEKEKVDWFSMNFHPICPKCGGCNMKIIVHSYQEASWEELENGGKFSFGLRIRGLGYWMQTFFYIN